MKSLIPVLVFALAIFTASNLKSQVVFLSGVEGGTYYQLANDIKKNCSVEIEVRNSKGSNDNFTQLMADNEIFVTFLQYDVLQTNKLINPKLKDEISILFPWFLDEEIHLLTKKDSKIKSIKDLKGKKVGVGLPESGTYVTATNIKNKTGISWDDAMVDVNKCYEAMMNGEIDAYFYVGGFPVESFINLPADANIKLVDIKHKSLNDTYKKKKIEKGTYKWQDKTINTYAVSTLMVIKTKDLPKEKEEQITKMINEVKNNMSKIQATGHAKWKDVYYRNQTIDWPYYYIKQE